MSRMRASTQNNIGVRRQYRPSGQLGIYRGPSETPPRQGQFTTHPMAGLGAVAIRHASAVNPVSPFVPYVGSGVNPGSRAEPIVLPGNQRATTVLSTPSGSTSTATTSPSGTYGGSPVANPIMRRTRPGFLPQPSSASQTGVTPTTTATSQPATGVALTSGAATTAQAGTPVPVGWSTSQSYTDSTGYIWTYSSADGWQATGVEPGSTAAANYNSSASTGTAGTTVSVNSGLDLSTITTWLDGQTIVSGIPNFFFVAGAGVVALLLMKSGKR